MEVVTVVVKMQSHDAGKRIEDFREVNKGYLPEEATKEANRCLQCAKPFCEQGCPVGVPIKEFIAKLKKDENNNASAALMKIMEKNYLPAICGRVCPQEQQCEKACILSRKGAGIAIGNLERYAADNGSFKLEQKESNGIKVAIVGSGPSGLTCAAVLASSGYSVTIFEALHDKGGVLRYGIPEFRLPNSVVDKEIKAIEDLGVKIEVNKVIGKTITLKEREAGFDAVFIGNGAGLPRLMNIPGENLNNVFTANEFLVRNNLMEGYKSDSKTPMKNVNRVVVIGGGNVAMDAARVARRLGSKVDILYRRTQKEMPARAEEIEHAMEEGIQIIELVSPVEVLGKGKVEQIRMQRMRLVESDDGRARPEPVEDAFVDINCDMVIVAIGQTPNPLLTQDLTSVGIELNKWGSIMVNELGQTSNPKFYAGGDIVGGNATVIKAMGDGKKAAENIIKSLTQ